jgi:hypothetical protein
MTLQFPNSPTDGELYTDTTSGNRWVWDSANTVWKSTSTFTQTITVSSTQPGSPVVGQLWWSQDYGRLFVYYNDGNSSQWVEANPADQTAGLVFNTANAAYGRANTALQNTSGTFAGSLNVTGNVGINTTSSNYRIDINSGAQGTTANSQVLLQRFYTASASSGGNSNFLELTDTRTVAGSSWNGCGARIQHKVDADYQAYIQFNGNNDYGISFGAGASSVSPTGVPERMRIDSSGRITKPAQPFARVYLRTVTTYTVSSGQIIPFNTAEENIGNCFNTSTGRFTCPVAGAYLCMSGIELIVPNTDWTFNYGVAKNASLIAGVYEGTPAKNYWVGRTYAMITCAAGDYLDFRILTNTTVSNESLPSDVRNYAMIYLLG